MKILDDILGYMFHIEKNGARLTASRYDSSKPRIPLKDIHKYIEATIIDGIQVIILDKDIKA